MSQTKKSNLLTVLGTVIWAIVVFIVTFSWRGASRREAWTWKTILSWCVYLVTLVIIVFAPKWNFPRLVDLLFGFHRPSVYGMWVYLHLSRRAQIVTLFSLPFVVWLIVLGLLAWIGTKKYQSAIDHLGLKSPTGLVPKLASIVRLENHQKRLLVHATGLDLADFQKKKGVLETSLNATVMEIRLCEQNRSLVEVILSEKSLPRDVPFSSLASSLKTPYSFLVGESLEGVIRADLLSVHHMMIAGSTGGGKSYFFKQLLTGLLQSSKHLQLYLIDLKRGVDMSFFKPLNNVRVAKEMMEAVSFLRAAVDEMDRRFIYLEKNGYTEIDPERDHLDRIVVAIDEASVLYTVEKYAKGIREMVETARELTDKLAKLGRAAGVHVILATQKVVKETIDTRVQSNINARMCFRVNTVQASMTVLGHKGAADLPEIDGRGIWSVGSRDVIVQAPFLRHQEMQKEIAKLGEKFNGKNSPLFQAMLEPVSQQEKSSGAYVKKDVKVQKPKSPEKA